MQFTRITTNSQKMGGVPCIRSLRIPVTTVVDMFAKGMRDQEILQALPDLEAEDIQEALYYASQAIRLSIETQGFKGTFEQGKQQSASEILRKQRFALSLSQLPCVSDEEQKDIEEHSGSPFDYDRADFVNMTDWVRNGTGLQ